MGSNLSQDTVLQALRAVQDPDLKKDIVALGFVQDLKIDGGAVSFRVVLTTPACPVKEQLKSQCESAVGALVGVTDVTVTMDAQVRASQAGARGGKTGIPGVKHIIAVSSGKGGVGKSTVSANLAVSLQMLGAKVGLMDADIYGPNIPTMMGVNVPPQGRQDEERGELLVPPTAHGVTVMSMGFLTKGDQPTVWRGPMLHSIVSQFLMKVDWGQLDYLIIDMPPGTGDVQISLTQMVPLSGAVVVTTPQEVAMQDVRKAMLMFEKVGVPLLGIVENMSWFEAPDTGKRYDIFGTGGGKALAEKFRLPLLAEMPLESAVRQAGDGGAPAVLAYKGTAGSERWLTLARAVAQQVSIQAAKTEAVSGIEIGAF
jgi:ATP-binding protein involved in chromosome partitioning